MKSNSNLTQSELPSNNKNTYFSEDIVDSTKVKQKPIYSLRFFFELCKSANSQIKTPSVQAKKIIHKTTFSKAKALKINDSSKSTVKNNSIKSSALVENIKLIDNNQERLFKDFSSYSPALYHSYLHPESLVQYIYSQCCNKLYMINKNYEESSVFILTVLEYYAYQMIYTHQLGCILTHLSVNWPKLKSLALVNKLVKMFPEVFKTKTVSTEQALKSSKAFLINYCLQCISKNVGNVYPQLKNLKYEPKKQAQSLHNRWISLIHKFFESLLLEYIPPQLSGCVIKIYSETERISHFKNLPKLDKINPYQPFVKILVSLFHYCYYLREKPQNIEVYYQKCSSPYMTVVQWPIIISNSHYFQLLDPRPVQLAEQI